MRFFFYGTLADDSANAVARKAHAVLRPLGPATAHGRLFAIPDPRGWYPAMLTGAGRVCGQLFEAMPAFGWRDLRLLDRYEDFDPARADISLYNRRPVEVRGPDGSRTRAQAYVYARALPAGVRPIPSGDFADWTRQGGKRIFTP